MSGYENGKIYKVVNENDDIIYIGSTKTSLNERWRKHHLNCNKYKIVLIENYSCESKTELRKMEQKFIDLYKEMGLLNQRKSYRTKEEEKQEKKEYIKEYKKCDKYKEYNKEYQKRKEKCPFCDKEMLQRSIHRHIKNFCKNKDNI